MSSPSKPRKAHSNAATQRIKAVVRKLPPNLPEDVFWKSCLQWVNENTVKDKWFRQGNLKGARFSAASIFSRAYIAFKTPEELATFSQNYDGHAFRDKQGNEYFAIVEYAPAQKLPMSTPKVDARQGTIEEDDNYKSFLQLLERGENPSKEKPPPQPTIDPNKPESTPLLDSLIAAKSGKKYKPSHLHPSKANRAADDAHFSRTQPIVPSGPVTLLTSTKGDASNKAVAPTSPRSPQVKPTSESNAPKGKGKGKAAAGAPSEQAASSHKPPKPKGAGKKPPAPSAEEAGGAKTSEADTKEDTTTKKTGQAKKKKQAESASSKAELGTETSENAENNAPKSGRGRGGRGRGSGLVQVPRILTKIIAEGTSNTPNVKSNPRGESETSSGVAATPGGSLATSDGPVLPSPLPAVSNVSTDDSVVTPSNGPVRGVDRGRRPFRARGRGRGRGRGVGDPA